MLVEIWSDVVCPWCYVGKRRLEHALGLFEHRDKVEVRWRSFELNRLATPAANSDYLTHLASKYRVDRPEAEAMIERITATARAEGLEYNLEKARPTGTFDAHRLLHLAEDRGRQEALQERLMAAYCCEGRLLGDPGTLVELAVEAGLDAHESRAVVEGDAYADAVRADEATGHALGLTGVPFFAIDRRMGAAGAQPADRLLRLLREAWADREPAGTLS